MFSIENSRSKLSVYLIQNTQETKRTLFNLTKQDKTWTFSRKSSFSSYVQHKNKNKNKKNKKTKTKKEEKTTTNNWFNLSCVSWLWEAGGRKRARFNFVSFFLIHLPVLQAHVVKQLVCRTHKLTWKVWVRQVLNIYTRTRGLLQQICK